MSSAAAPTNSRPPAPICPQRRRPTPLPPKPLPNQIPIDREPLTSPRGFLLRRLSDAGSRHGCTNRRPAGIRNPSRPPAGSFFGGFRTPALATAVQIDDRPASETLHDGGPFFIVWKSAAVGGNLTLGGQTRIDA